MAKKIELGNAVITAYRDVSKKNGNLYNYLNLELADGTNLRVFINDYNFNTKLTSTFETVEDIKE